MRFASLWIGIISMTALLLVSSVAAQDLSLPDPDGLDFPNEMYIPPEFYEESLPPDGVELEEPSLLVGPPRVEPRPQTDEPWIDRFDAGAADYDYPMWDMQPAVPISSGTWLERGVWYAEADAVMSNRTWSRTDTLLALQPNVQQGGNRALFLRGSHPGEDAAVRTTLGRFLYRDDDNRDHTAEFTVTAGGDWVEHVTLSSSTPNQLFLPVTINGLNLSFDNSTRQVVNYSSRFNSFEANYRVKQRMGRDQMIMDPNGHWRREASSGFNRSYLIGLRYIDLDEIFDWRAEDIVVAGDDGQYLINTDNDLFGVQAGAGISYETGRWSLGLNGKMGLYLNDADEHSQLDFTVDDVADFDRRSSESELSWVGEASLIGRWHLTPAFSLRAGTEVSVIESIALATKQINFIDDFSQVNTAGYAFYIGGTLGFEGYW